MTVRFDTAEFSEAITWLGAAAPVGRATVPELSAIHIAATDGWCVLEATNIETFAVVRLPCSVDEPLDALVPAALLVPFAKRLTGETVRLIADAGGLEVRCGATSGVLRTLSHEFPSPPQIASGATLTLYPSLLDEVAKRVGPAARTEPGDYFLHGIHLANGAATATDRYRLHRLRHELLKGDATVPVGAISAAAKIGEKVEVEVGERHISFRTDTYALWSTLVEGAFPATAAHFGMDLPVTVRIERDVLTEAIQRVAALGADRLRVLAGDDAVNLYAWGEKGEVSDSVSATVEGNSSTVVSTRYLLDSLRAMDGDEVLIEFPEEGERKPLRLSAGRNVQALVMRIAEPETL